MGHAVAVIRSFEHPRTDLLTDKAGQIIYK